jgi:hypothetical protein
MSEIIDLDSRRKPKIKVPCYEEWADEVHQGWSDHYEAGTLNAFFMSCIPWAVKEGTNYLNDLSGISLVEKKLKLSVQVTSPDYDLEDPEENGWVASFRIGELAICTAGMDTEEEARALLVLIFAKFKRELSK